MRARYKNISLISQLSILGLAVAVFGYASQANAGQTYAIDWYLIGSGGTAASTQGEYVLRGSIAQPVVGSSTGGGYSLDAGFWHGIPSGCPDCIFSNGFEMED